MAENFWLDKRVLLTGGTGFVGRHLLERLLNLGSVVADAELNHLALSIEAIERYRCDITNYDEVNRMVSRFQPDIVFHLAAQPIVDVALRGAFDTLETNIRGTYNLLEVCARSNVGGFVHFSTDKVYGETDASKTGSIESDPLTGVAHPYNASKLCGDILAQSYQSFTDLPISIIRSGNIYGESDTHFERLIPYVCRMLVEGKPIHLRSDGFLYRDYIYVGDVIEALLLVGQRGYDWNGIYNLGSEKSYAVKEIIAELVTIHGKLDEMPFYDNITQLELSYQHMNYDKIKTELGWQPKTKIEDGLRKTYNWYWEMYGND